MTIHIDRLIELLARLCDEKKIKATTAESLKGGVIAGVSATLGGLLLGPVGLAIGAAVGGISAAAAANNKFEPLGKVLKNLPERNKQELMNHLVQAFCDFGIDDVIGLYMLLNGNGSMREMALRHTISYLTQQGNMKIKS